MLFNLISKIFGRHYSKSEMSIYLDQKHQLNTSDEIKKHIDGCEKCWDLWNKARWDRTKGTTGFEELKEYLGNNFSEYDEYYDSSWALAKEWNNLNPQNKEEISDYYKKTKNYLFNLIIWHESGDRPPLYLDLKKLIENFNIKVVIDFGCGVGTDSIFLLENGIETKMVDFIGHSSDFLLWRIKKRNLTLGEFINTEKIKKLPSADMFWAIDVLEHLPDPSRILELIPDDLRIFIHRSQFNDTANGRHPHHMTFNEDILKKGLKDKGFREVPWPGLSVWVKSPLSDIIASD